MRRKFGLTLAQLRVMDKSPSATAVYIPDDDVLWEVWFNNRGKPLRIVHPMRGLVWTLEAGALFGGKQRLDRVIELAKEVRRTYDPNKPERLQIRAPRERRSTFARRTHGRDSQ